MPGDAYILGACLAASAVTVGLRLLPFLVIGPLRTSGVVRFLGVHMPAGVMVVLVAYTVRDVPLRPWPHGLPEACAIAATAAVHLWRANAVVSIVAGTACYIALTAGPFG